MEKLLAVIHDRNIYQYRSSSIAEKQSFKERPQLTIRAIVFDLDGTLAEFNLDYKAVRAEVKQLLANHGIPASLLSIKESIFEMLKKAKVYMRNVGREEEFPEVQEHILSLARRRELQAARETSPLPGVFETLKNLKIERNLKLGIFTINSQKSTDYILVNFRLKQFFDAIITREAVSNVKPDPTHLAAALKALSAKTNETLVVGDSIADMLSAKALNVEAIGIARNDEAARKLNHAGAKHIVRSITDLPKLIANLGQSNT